MTNAFIKVAGINFPYPAYESGLQTQSTAVDSGFNVNNVFIGRKVGRDRSKIELSWQIMAASQWAQLCQLFDEDSGGSFVNPVEYYDMAKGEIVTRQMYVNDRTARPHTINSVTGEWLIARDCKMNLIDTGR